MQDTLFERFMLWVSDWSGINYTTKAQKEAKASYIASTFEEQKAEYDRLGYDADQIGRMEWLAASMRGEDPPIQFNNGPLAVENGNLSLADESDDADLELFLIEQKQIRRLQKDLAATLKVAGIFDEQGRAYEAGKYRAEARTIESKLRAMGA